MSFFDSIEWQGALALLLSGGFIGFIAGWVFAGIRWRADRPKTIRSRSPQYIQPDWRGFDLSESHVESIVVDRRNRFANGSLADRPVKGAGEAGDR